MGYYARLQCLSEVDRPAGRVPRTRPVARPTSSCAHRRSRCFAHPLEEVPLYGSRWLQVFLRCRDKFTELLLVMREGLLLQSAAAVVGRVKSCERALRATLGVATGAEAVGAGHVFPRAEILRACVTRTGFNSSHDREELRLASSQINEEHTWLTFLTF